MLVLGIDFETTGLNPEVDRVVEMGAVLWDTGAGVPLVLRSEFIYDDTVAFSKEAEEVHKIAFETLKKYGKPFGKVFKNLDNEAEAIVAHNGTTFDKLFYEAECKRAGIKPWDKVWIDTQTDIKYPSHITTRKLSYLCAEHGFLNYLAHRAVFDVVAMLQILQRYDVEAAYWYAQQPPVTLQALVSFDDRQKAKDTGYRWNPDTKQWLRTVRLPDIEAEQKIAEENGFKIREIKQKSLL